MMEEFAKNGNALPRELNKNPVKIVVIGEPGCGKTTFIKGFLHFAKNHYGNSAGVIETNRCEFYFKGPRIIDLTEIPNNFEDYRIARLNHYGSAKVFVFMFDLNDDDSFTNLRDKWFNEANEFVQRTTPFPRIVVILGNKNDIVSEVEDTIPYHLIYGNHPHENLRKIHKDLSSHNNALILNIIKLIFEAAFDAANQ